MGTRFVCTREAPVHYNIKHALIMGTERDTNLIFRTMHNTARVFKNEISDEVVRTERRPGGCHYDDVRPLVAGVRGRAALEAGEINGGIISAGMVIGLIDDIPSCKELIERMVAECRIRLAAASSCFRSPDDADIDAVNT
jgi:nitronate monooxygenase